MKCLTCGHLDPDHTLAVRWARFMAWWRPFWYGPPCKHGVYGVDTLTERPYRVLGCRACWRELQAECRAEEIEARAEELRAAFPELAPSKLRTANPANSPDPQAVKGSV